MTVLTEATNSNHRRSKALLGMTVIFILVLTVLVTAFLVAVVSVG